MHRCFISVVATAAFLWISSSSSASAQVLVVQPEPGPAPAPGEYYQPVYRNFQGYPNTPLYGPNLGYGTYFGGDITRYGPSRTGISNNALFPAFDWSRLRKRR